MIQSVRDMGWRVCDDTRRGLEMGGWGDSWSEMGMWRDT